MTGIEPAFSAWEADVLPLNDIRRTAGLRSEEVSRTRPPKLADGKCTKVPMTVSAGSAASGFGSLPAQYVRRRLVHNHMPAYYQRRGRHHDPERR